MDGGFGGLDSGLKEGVGIAREHEHHLYLPWLTLGRGGCHRRGVGQHAALYKALLRAGIRHRGQRVNNQLGI